ncbi:hypothetical protein Cylst_1475 [Cylindrospermum stagnale PCC 7417]|uniref:Uncharacterized protein n=1 Tax=Cylindrospermum stagnale PCC 7417 TaxID=56107 RepID=K9WVB7_9NOST|nr:hypothetical protein Cylst_1475 [Cylindrospermum stagnale PCC 7417]
MLIKAIASSMTVRPIAGSNGATPNLGEGIFFIAEFELAVVYLT